jgi:hypothetical protein
VTPFELFMTTVVDTSWYCRLDGKDIRSSQLPAIVAAADDVLAAIDTTALAAFLALRAPAEEDDSDASAATAGAPAAASSAAGGAAGKELAAAGAAAPSPAASYKAQKVVMDEAKAALLEALTRKLAAQLDLAEVRQAPRGGAGSSRVEYVEGWFGVFWHVGFLCMVLGLQHKQT